MNRAENRLFLGIVFVSGILLIGRASCFYTKGMVAQHLLEKAWRLSKVNGKVVKPWGWADTHPVGKIRIPAIGLDQVILEGTHTESLAFGPAHLSGTPKPGEPGNICIAGHRDSHMAFLVKVRTGDVVKITTYLTDISTYADFAKARTEAFPGGIPASTAVATPALGMPELLVEVEAMAVIGSGS